MGVSSVLTRMCCVLMLRAPAWGVQWRRAPRADAGHRPAAAACVSTPLVPVWDTATATTRFIQAGQHVQPPHPSPRPCMCIDPTLSQCRACAGTWRTRGWAASGAPWPSEGTGWGWPRQPPALVASPGRLGPGSGRPAASSSSRGHTVRRQLQQSAGPRVRTDACSWQHAQHMRQQRSVMAAAASAGPSSCHALQPAANTYGCCAGGSGATISPCHWGGALCGARGCQSHLLHQPPAAGCLQQPASTHCIGNSRCAGMEGVPGLPLGPFQPHPCLCTTAAASQEAARQLLGSSPHRSGC
jgi:hypothetical protein